MYTLSLGIRLGAVVDNIQRVMDVCLVVRVVAHRSKLIAQNYDRGGEKEISSRIVNGNRLNK